MKLFQQGILKSIFTIWFVLVMGLAYGGVGQSGSGRTSFGAITAFGSIFVSGIEYSTSTANIIINGIPNQPESALKLGMAVRVEGSINPDGLTGTATIVEYIGDIEGVVDAAPVVTGTRGTFRIYGLVVNTDSKTIYDNVAGLVIAGVMVCCLLPSGGRGALSLEGADAAQVAEVHPDKECLADDILVRHKSPEA